jgi:hypothetical protein
MFINQAIGTSLFPFIEPAGSQPVDAAQVVLS